MSGAVSFAGKPAVFLDRDGVINKSPGEHEYVRNADGFAMLSGVPEAIKLLNEAGFPVVVISNQRGVARGLMTQEDLDAITGRMRSELAAVGARLERIYYCPHEKGTCDCRKPLPGMIHRAQKELGVDLGKSYLVGDTGTDIAAGQAAGCTTFIVLTGKTTAETVGALSPQPQFVAKDLVEAARRIIAHAKEGDGLPR